MTTYKKVIIIVVRLLGLSIMIQAAWNLLLSLLISLSVIGTGWLGAIITFVFGLLIYAAAPAIARLVTRDLESRTID